MTQWVQPVQLPPCDLTIWQVLPTSGAQRQYDAALMKRTDSMLTAVERAKTEHRDASEAWAGWVFEWSLGFQLPLGEATRLVTYEKGYQDPDNASSFFPEAVIGLFRLGVASVGGLGFLGTYMNIPVLKNCRPPYADVWLCMSCQHRVWFGQRTPDGEQRIFPIEVLASNYLTIPSGNLA